MDILNWVYLIKNKLIRTTVQDPQKDLVILGGDVTYAKRGDKYQSYGITVEDFATQIGANSIFSLSYGPSLPEFMYVVTSYVSMLSEYTGPFTYSKDGKTMYADFDYLSYAGNIYLSGNAFSDPIISPYGKIEYINITGGKIPLVIIQYFYIETYPNTLPISIEAPTTPGISITNMTTPIEINKLPKYIKNLNIYSISNTNSLNLSSVENVQNFTVESCDNLISVDISGLKNSGNVALDMQILYIVNCSNLTSITLPTNPYTLSMFSSFANCALNQSTIDGILKMYVDLDGTSGKIEWGVVGPEFLDLAAGTNAAPSAIGLGYVSILVGRGATVTHN